MATLYIEHAITDRATWLGAFARFGEARQRAGVRAEPPSNGSPGTTVWASAAASPGLGGTPRARVLSAVEPT